MAEHQEREHRFERQMTDAEALMWNIEKDPWLNPNGAVVTLLDRPPNWEHLRTRIRNAVATIPRLRERVVPSLGRLRPPTWEPDAEFDFDYHLRRVSLPGPGSTAQLFEFATRFYEDPFDRTRPLWMFTVVEGIAGGKAALVWKSHHSITDGTGSVRLAERYMEPAADSPVPDDVDLDSIVAADIAARASDDPSGGSKPLHDLFEGAKRFAESNRKLVADAALVAVDPSRAQEFADATLGNLRGLKNQVSGRTVEGGSPMWADRSRRRHLERIRVPLADAKAAGAELGGSINDFFVTGAVMGILEHHKRFDVEVEALNTSFVVSTRHDDAIGGNSFVPTLLQASGADMSPQERFTSLQTEMAELRAGVSGEGSVGDLARIANMLPTSVVTRVARQQAAKQDFATSNFRAAPFPTYISGGLVLQNATLGPVAATAMNLTALSYNGQLDMGVFVDPAAIAEPQMLRRDLLEGYRALAAAGGLDANWGPDEFDAVDAAAGVN